MKKRWAWRYTVRTAQGATWGTCPKWFADFDRFGVKVEGVTVERVLVVGGHLQPCLADDHPEGHPRVSRPAYFDND